MADEEIVQIELLGRKMDVRVMTPGQAVLMSRFAQRAQMQSESSDNPAATTQAYSQLMLRLMNLVDSLIVSESDRQAVEDALIERKLDIEDLYVIAMGGRRPEPVPDDADVEAKPKKKAVKKTANPRRATR